MSSAVASELLACLQRLLPPAVDSRQQALLADLVTALVEALEQGELGLDLRGPAPPVLAPESWPQDYLQVAQASGWLLPDAAADGLSSERSEPLVLDGQWLRWRRWHQQLQQCLDQLVELASSALEPGLSEPQREACCTQGLDPGQCAAVAAVLRHRLVLLRGGPGTGKTSTVVQMLAAALQHQPQLQIHLAAPTGKAAARLKAAVTAGAAALPGPEAATLAELACTTLHRLLEASAGGRFGRGIRRPLALDLLVVDELSMVDLPLMEALLQALPPQARLVLVGDDGQLPPVGIGAVLEELCRPPRLAALGPAAVELQTTYRNNGAIATLAAALRRPLQPALDPLVVLQPLLRQLQPSDNVQWLASDPAGLPEPLLARLRLQQQQLQQRAAVVQGWADGDGDGELDAATASACQALLDQLEQCIALTPIRHGRWGVAALHRALLGETEAVPLQRWPLGTPVLNRLNRPEQGLANGDIGVLVQRGGERWVLFNGPRLVHPARLGAAEPALALTVHKAQGSQYNEVLLLLPPGRRSDPRLLYTGLTRARQRAVLITPPCDPADDLAPTAANPSP
ncbi:MAG: AAA family ATPase [Cyanobacteriota bacterium]|nr:AAA family ATPase [Cyanobacteriota bacterium]